MPALPEKNVVEKYKMTQEFVEARRAALTVFVNKVVRAPPQLPARRGGELVGGAGFAAGVAGLQDSTAGGGAEPPARLLP